MQPAAPVIERRAEWGRPSGQERGGRPTSFLGDGPHASPSRTDGNITCPELPAVAASLSSLRGPRDASPRHSRRLPAPLPQGHPALLGPAPHRGLASPRPGHNVHSRQAEARPLSRRPLAGAGTPSGQAAACCADPSSATPPQRPLPVPLATRPAPSGPRSQTGPRPQCTGRRGGKRAAATSAPSLRYWKHA